MIATLVCLAQGLGLVAVAQPTGAGPSLFDKPVDLMDNVPPSFPRFHIPGHEKDARWLSRYLWYHFSHRGGAGPCLFNQEYVTTSDLWMGGAKHPRLPHLIQPTHRHNLLAIRMDDEGYVWTHQHFSHAHEHGWPFPMWTQGRAGKDGLTAGWHFQTNGPGWVWQHYLRHHPKSPYGRARAIEGWELHHVASKGIVEGRWRLVATGAAPTITTPATVSIDAFNSPFVQLRWRRAPQADGATRPYIEWLAEGDTAFGPDRRVEILPGTGNPAYEAVSKTTHSLVRMHRHPTWQGRVRRIRIHLAPDHDGTTPLTFDIDSFFTVYDTRHSINNPIYILACWNLYRWTGDRGFLAKVIGPMRRALRYQQTVMGGLEHKHIRNPWVGHDGLAGWLRGPDGKKQMRKGHGIGNNYWDLLPFGWDDMYATSQYYASTLVMAEVEQAILDHPEWKLPRGEPALDPASLRRHAAEVRAEANATFWNEATGRFVACIDQAGKRHDYGFTFLNLDAIWYGMANDEHARSIMEWLGGKRIVTGDTSTGEDIYHWRFGPRATTKRNVEWYGFFWTHPENIPWGGQVQDGGAVLGFSFYDMWAWLHVVGPDAAWDRLAELLRWEREVWAAGGYRKYYEGGKRGTTLQGGGTAGGLGIDHEFWESSLVPSIVVYGFLGLDPDATSLVIRPKLPKACPTMGVSDVLYRGVRLDVRAGAESVELALKDKPAEPIVLRFDDARGRKDTGEVGRRFALTKPGIYRFEAKR